MAWSIGDYNDFLDVVQDVFGADRADAADLYRDMRDILNIGPLTVGDLEEYADMASDLMAPVVADEDEDLDMEEWFDVGDEIEVTADITYHEG